METKKRHPQAKPGMTSTELRAVIKQLVNEELKNAQALLDQCSLEKRAALLTRIGNTVLPRETAEVLKSEKGIYMDYGDGKEPKFVSWEEEKPVKKASKSAVAKKNADPRTHLTAIFISEYNYITGRLDELAPDKRLELLLRLALFTIPCQSAKNLSEAENEVDEHVTMLLD